MLEFRIWKIVICENVVSMWNDMLVVYDWWATSNLIKVVESSENDKGNGEHSQRNHVIDISLMVKESNLISRNGLGHILKVHHEQNGVNDHENARNLDHGESSLYDLINLGAAIQIKASERLLLILNQDILIVFPNSRNIYLLAGTSEIIHTVSVRKVFASASMVHQLLLAELW